MCQLRPGQTDELLRWNYGVLVTQVDVFRIGGAIGHLLSFESGHCLIWFIKGLFLSIFRHFNISNAIKLKK
jgi:hypothetical protein